MLFSPPLLKGKLIKRYKRFLADVCLENKEAPVTIHCPNSGSMLGLTKEGTSVWVSTSPNLSRKLPYTWEIGEEEGVLVGVNTQNPNRLVAEGLKQKFFSPFLEYTTFRQEVPTGTNSRLDFVLEKEGKPPCYLEVKNVHLKKDIYAAFPDSITDRGTKHLEELISLKQQGAQAVQLYIIQRSDLSVFTFAHWIDSLYAKTAYKAKEMGVIFLAYICSVTPDEITLLRKIPITFS